MDKWKREAIKLLVARRTLLGMSQADAAERAGIGQSHWSLVEAGRKRPTYETLREMCRAVGLSWSDARVSVGK